MEYIIGLLQEILTIFGLCEWCFFLSHFWYYTFNESMIINNPTMYSTFTSKEKIQNQEIKISNLIEVFSSMGQIFNFIQFVAHVMVGGLYFTF